LAVFSAFFVGEVFGERAVGVPESSRSKGSCASGDGEGVEFVEFICSSSDMNSEFFKSFLKLALLCRGFLEGFASVMDLVHHLSPTLCPLVQVRQNNVR